MCQTDGWTNGVMVEWTNDIQIDGGAEGLIGLLDN